MVIVLRDKSAALQEIDAGRYCLSMTEAPRRTEALAHIARLLGGLEERRRRRVLGQPLIQAVQIRKFRNIDFAAANLGRVNVIIGPNGAGKTNLLTAVAMLSPQACGEEIVRYSDSFGALSVNLS